MPFFDIKRKDAASLSTTHKGSAINLYKPAVKHADKESSEGNTLHDVHAGLGRGGAGTYHGAAHSLTKVDLETISSIRQIQTQLEQAFAAEMNNDPDGGYSSDEASGDEDVAGEERVPETPPVFQDDHERRSPFPSPASVVDDIEDEDRTVEAADSEGNDAQQPVSNTKQARPLYPIFLRPVKLDYSLLSDEEIAYEDKGVSLEELRLEKQAIKDEQGLTELVCFTLRKELALYKTVDGVDEKLLRHIAYLIAIETHPEVLKVATTGGWASSSLTNKRLDKALVKLKNRAFHGRHPYLYINEFADKQGRSLTPHQLLVVVGIAEDYYKGKDRVMASRIDRFQKPYPTQTQQLVPGFRKYIWNKKKDRVSQARIGRGLEFCNNLRKRLAIVPREKRDLPLDVPLIELGYSNDIPRRLANHRKHITSNPIMNLFEAISDIQWPGRFSLWQFVIHCCCKPNRVALGEIFFTQLCEGYIHNAGGFSTYQAGVSVASAYDSEYCGWEDAEQWVMLNMLVGENSANEHRQRGLNVQKVQAREAVEYDDSLAALTMEQLREGIAKGRKQVVKNIETLTSHYQEQVEPVIEFKEIVGRIAGEVSYGELDF